MQPSTSLSSVLCSLPSTTSSRTLYTASISTYDILNTVKNVQRLSSECATTTTADYRTTPRTYLKTTSFSTTSTRTACIILITSAPTMAASTRGVSTWKEL